MLVEVGFDAWVRSEVDAERLVVSAYYHALGAEHWVLQEDARPLVVSPVKG